MRKQGEITVFLSLTLVCVLSLLLGLLETARTAGARLYLNMAANSAMASLMSQYNRNLWDMYHLLFLEYESERAIAKSFESYLDFYLEQENFYPARCGQVKLTDVMTMDQDGGRALEDGILSCVKYRLPEAAADLTGIAAQAARAAAAGDFGTLFDVCRQAGKRTRRLEKARRALEDALEDMRGLREKTEDAADEERKGKFESNAGKLIKRMGQFPGLLKKYEDELSRLTEHRKETEKSGAGEAGMGADAAGSMSLELEAYRSVEADAEELLSGYREMEKILDTGRGYLKEALKILEESGEDSEEDEEETDWSGVWECLEQVQIPESALPDRIDTEKSAAFDRLEEVLSGDLLKLVVPEGTEISTKKVSLKESLARPAGTPGESKHEIGIGGSENGTEQNLLERFLTGEYILLYFASFLRSDSGRSEPGQEVLSYEQEYLLCGKPSDRENLAGTVEQLLMVRGAMNLLYLMNSAEKRKLAEGLALAVSGGSAPVQLIITFLVLSLWAFGEAVQDMRGLLDGGCVPFWKDDSNWRLSLEGLLALEFLEGRTENSAEGSDYGDYLRVLFFLKDRELRNYRMMDLIQWNVRRRQEDFSVTDCAYRIRLQAEVMQRHIFLVKNEYESAVDMVWSY